MLKVLVHVFLTKHRPGNRRRFCAIKIRKLEGWLFEVLLKICTRTTSDGLYNMPDGMIWSRLVRILTKELIYLATTYDARHVTGLTWDCMNHISKLWLRGIFTYGLENTEVSKILLYCCGVIQLQNVIRLDHLIRGQIIRTVISIIVDLISDQLCQIKRLNLSFFVTDEKPRGVRSGCGAKPPGPKHFARSRAAGTL